MTTILFATETDEGRQALLATMDRLVYGHAIEQAGAGVQWAFTTYRKAQRLARMGWLYGHMTPAQARVNVRRKIAHARAMRDLVRSRGS